MTNDISFESPNIGLLEFKKKLGVASSRGDGRLIPETFDSRTFDS